MSDDIESESEESFGKTLAKGVTSSVVGAAGMVVGLYVGSIAVDKIKVLVAARAAKKAEPDTVWETP